MTKYQRELLTTALAYARAGYYVFPLTVMWDEARGKKKLIIPFPKAEAWDAESTTDEKTIREWFDTPRRGMKGIGIDTGHSGIVAVDLDVSNGKRGLEQWAELPEQQDTPMLVDTHSGGVHRFYRDPTGRITNSAGEVAPDIDIRGNGGFVITAPTRVWGTDRAYTVRTEIVPVADLPELTPGMIEVITARQDSARPKFDAAIHGSYKVSANQGAEVVANRLARVAGGKGMRAAIFGYAVGVAQYEGAKAALDDATLDEGALFEFVRDQVLSVVSWAALDEDDETWIADGITKGLAAPWEIVKDEEVFPEVEADVPLADLLQREARRLPGFPSRDHGAAGEVLVGELVGRYLYPHGLGWHEWAGDRWSSELRVPVRHAVTTLVRKHMAESRQMTSAYDKNDELKTLREELAEIKASRGEKSKTSLREAQITETIEKADAWANSWGSYSDWWRALDNGYNYAQVIKYVEDNPGKIYVPAADLDRDPNLLNCPNGTVDLRTGVLRRHDPADFITKSTGVPYVPAATHKLWDAARQAFAPGVESWLQMKVGEGAFGVPSHDDTMLFCFGQGSNAKSTLSDAILRSLGDYAVFLHDKALLGNEHDHGTEKMVFRGARWAILEELPEAQVLRPAVIKKLIGTSKITARMMRQDNVTFDASHSLLVNSNHRPQVLENDRGTWRRLIAVPWPFTFKFQGEELDDAFDRPANPAIKAGIARSIEVQKAALAWIVAGAVKYTEAGSCGPLPDVVAAETASWRMDSDTFGTFFEQELALDKTAAVSSKELLDVYNEWLSDLGKRPVSDGYIGTRLASMKGAKGVHSKTLRRNVKRVAVSSRGPLASLPEQFRSWVGVRWMTPEEQAKNAA